MNPRPLMTVQQHIYEEQRRHHPNATGEFSWLLSGLTLATKLGVDVQNLIGVIWSRGLQGGGVMWLRRSESGAITVGCLRRRGT